MSNSSSNNNFRHPSGTEKHGYQPKDSGGSGTSSVKGGYQPTGSGGSPTNPPPKKP